MGRTDGSEGGFGVATGSSLVGFDSTSTLAWPGCVEVTEAGPTDSFPLELAGVVIDDAMLLLVVAVVASWLDLVEAGVAWLGFDCDGAACDTDWPFAACAYENVVAVDIAPEVGLAVPTDMLFE